MILSYTTIIAMVFLSSCRCLSVQIGQPVEGFKESIVFLGKMEPDQIIYRLTEEAGPRNGPDADFSGKPFAELQV